MMKNFLTILLLLSGIAASAQYTPNSGAYQYKGLKAINSLQPPSDLANPVTSKNAPDSNYAALYYNKTDTTWYQFNPVSKRWSKFAGVNIGTNDSVFITSIDSIFISNTDSIFIVSGADTIYIGQDNSPRDTAHLAAQYGIIISSEDSLYRPNGPDVSIAIDTAVLKDFISTVTNNDTSIISNKDFVNATFVDDIVCAPTGSEANGTKYLVCPSGATGAFAGHENDIAEKVGGVWTFTDPTDQQVVIVTPTSAGYQYTNPNWNRIFIWWRSDGNAGIGDSAFAGRTDSVNMYFRSHNKNFIYGTPSQDIYAPKWSGMPANNYVKFGTGGKFDTGLFRQLVAGNNITITHSATADTISSTGSGTSGRFGIEDNLGLQDRTINHQNYFLFLDHLSSFEADAYDTTNNSLSILMSGGNTAYLSAANINRGLANYISVSPTHISFNTNYSDTAAKVVFQDINSLNVSSPTRIAVWDNDTLKSATAGSLGGGTVTSIATTSPITGGTITSTGTIGINNAAADGSTKGAASFTANDFDATSGNISIDYTNGQAASGSTKGFLTSADWTTFNNKQNAITLTTTGTSGAATLVGSTLNIPQYSSGGGTVTGGVINWPGTIYSTPTTATVASGTLTFAPTLATQSAYTVFSNATGSTATPSFSKIPINVLSATGTPSSTTALFGDNTWKTTPSGSGLVNRVSLWLDAATQTYDSIYFNPTRKFLGLNNSGPNGIIDANPAAFPGTVSPTNGSATLTGVGTRFNENFNAKDTITINGVNYAISQINSATSITLHTTYAGTTGSGVAYTNPSTARGVFKLLENGNVNSDGTTFIVNAGGARSLGGSSYEANLGMGRAALASLTTGYGITAFGGGALQANTTGPANTAVGTRALAAVTTASNNTAMGDNALLNVSGSNNTGIGAFAMNVGAASGGDNIGIGTFAAARISTGAKNIIIGNSSAQFITTGGRNIALGDRALGGPNISTGNDNITIGMTAGYDLTGAASSNIVIGDSALALNTPLAGEPAFNTIIGTRAGGNIRGIKNLCLGYRATLPYTVSNSANIFNTIFITGQNAVDSLASTSSLTGINTTTPLSSLDVAGSFGTAYVAKTATYAVSATDNTIDCTSGTFTVTLPTAIGITGRQYTIVNSGSGTITIATTGSQTFTNINATPTSLTLAAVGAGAITSYTVKATGAAWIVIAKVKNE